MCWQLAPRLFLCANRYYWQCKTLIRIPRSSLMRGHSSNSTSKHKSILKLQWNYCDNKLNKVLEYKPKYGIHFWKKTSGELRQFKDILHALLSNAKCQISPNPKPYCDRMKLLKLKSLEFRRKFEFNALYFIIVQIWFLISCLSNFYLKYDIANLFHEICWMRKLHNR